MEKEEWLLWQEHLPEIITWLGYSPANGQPSRTDCLEAVEMRALAQNQELAERFLAIASNWKLTHLPDTDLSLFLRVMNNFHSGRCSELSMGEFARRIFVTARRRAQINQDYLNSFEVNFVTSQ